MPQKHTNATIKSKEIGQLNARLRTKMIGSLLWNIDNKDFAKVLYAGDLFLLVKDVECISHQEINACYSSKRTISLFISKSLHFG